MSSSLQNLFHVNSRQLKEQLMTIFAAGLVPFVRSSPGGGKSSIYRWIADEFNLQLVDIRLSMYETPDFTGLPWRGEKRTEYLPTSLFPLKGDPLPKGKNGWLVLLDEYSHAEPEMIRASQKLILDRMVGECQLHDDVFIGLAGNNIDDNALSGAVGTAINSRVTHLKLVSNTDIWLEDVAIPFGFDHRIIGFLSNNKNKLNDFDAEQDDHSFCCERTWEFISKVIKGKNNVKGMVPAIAGTISPGVASEFIQFCAVYDNLISINQIVADPVNCPLPTDNPTRWALVTQLVGQLDLKNIDAVCEYIDRFQVQYTIIFLRMISPAGPLFNTPAVRGLLVKVGKLF